MPVGTMVQFVDGAVPVAADFNNNFSVLNTTTHPVSMGGTGLTTGTSGGVLYFLAATTIGSSALLAADTIVLGGGAGAAPVSAGAMTNGQLLIGSTGAAPVVAALTAGSNVTITNAAGSISIASTAVSAATQAEMEAASSTTVYASPGNTQHHPGVAKGWVSFEITGSILASHNTTSITDTGPGDWTIVWGTDFSGANYGVQFTYGGTGTLIPRIVDVAYVAGSTRVSTVDASTQTATDPGAASGRSMNVLVHGDQA